jgi:hypothetical protein
MQMRMGLHLSHTVHILVDIKYVLSAQVAGTASCCGGQVNICPPLSVYI